MVGVCFAILWCAQCAHTHANPVIDDKLNLKKTTNERKTTNDAAKQCANFSISNFQLYRHLLFTFCFRCAFILIKPSFHSESLAWRSFAGCFFCFIRSSSPFHTYRVVHSFCLGCVAVAVYVVDFQRLAIASSLVSLSMVFRVQCVLDGACLLKVYDALFSRSIEGKGVCMSCKQNDFMKLNYEFICKHITSHDICMCNPIFKRQTIKTATSMLRISQADRKFYGFCRC